LNYIWPIIISILVSWCGIMLFRKFKILDKPWNDLKNTRKPVPTMQWIFVYLWFFLIILILFPGYFQNNIFLWLLFGSLPIFVIELLEELHYMWKIKFKVPQYLRLIWHILAWILAVYIWHFWPQELLLWSHKIIISQWVFALLFVLRSILCINAINRFDGIYAQASGVSSIGFLTIFLLIKFVVFRYYTDFTQDNMQILLLVQNMSFVLFSVSLVSTFVEYKPIGLVRDLGIMFYGFSLAYLSVIWWAKIWTLIVALSLVIFDAIRVGLYRIFVMKKNPLRWDYTHLHHRLMWLGWERFEVRAFVRIRSLIMMILILLQWTNRTNKLIIFALMALVFFGINYYLFVVKKLNLGLRMEKE